MLVHVASARAASHRAKGRRLRRRGPLGHFAASAQGVLQVVRYIFGCRCAVRKIAAVFTGRSSQHKPQGFQFIERRLKRRFVDLSLRGKAGRKGIAGRCVCNIRKTRSCRARPDGRGAAAAGAAAGDRGCDGEGRQSGAAVWARPCGPSITPVAKVCGGWPRARPIGIDSASFSPRCRAEDRPAIPPVAFWNVPAMLRRSWVLAGEGGAVPGSYRSRSRPRSRSRCNRSYCSAASAARPASSCWRAVVLACSSS